MIKKKKNESQLKYLYELLFSLVLSFIHFFSAFYTSVALSSPSTLAPSYLSLFDSKHPVFFYNVYKNKYKFVYKIFSSKFHKIQVALVMYKRERSAQDIKMIPRSP